MVQHGGLQNLYSPVRIRSSPPLLKRETAPLRGPPHSSLDGTLDGLLDLVRPWVPSAEIRLDWADLRRPQMLERLCFADQRDVGPRHLTLAGWRVRLGHPSRSAARACRRPSRLAPADRRRLRGTHTGVSLSACAGGVRQPERRIRRLRELPVDGAPATTKVDAVVSGASVSGTAVSELGKGTHTVQLECASRYGDTWALGGTTEQTTVPGEPAGDWSAVIVKDGSPQQIGIWLSDDKSEGIDCDGWLAAIDFATITPENFRPVESGALVAPPDPAP